MEYWNIILIFIMNNKNRCLMKNIIFLFMVMVSIGVQAKPLPVLPIPNLFELVHVEMRGEITEREYFELKLDEVDLDRISLSIDELELEMELDSLSELPCYNLSAKILEMSDIETDIDNISSRYEFILFKLRNSSNKVIGKYTTIAYCGKRMILVKFTDGTTDLIRLE